MPPETRAGFASYIDLLWRERTIFASFHQQGQQLHRLTRLAAPLDHPYAALDCIGPSPRSSTSPARRRASPSGLYVKALGSDHNAAVEHWSAALEAVVSLLRSRDLTAG